MNTFLLFLNMGGGEFTVILLMIFLLFGGKGIPNLARTLGKTVREFKDAASGIERDIMGTTSGIHREVNEQVQKIKREIEEPEEEKKRSEKDETLK